MISDEAGAIAALRDGDIRGLEMLVQLYQRRAVGVALQIIDNREAAEDVVADAFLSVYDRIQQYDPRRPFTPWFFRIVVNAALKAASRREKTRPDSAVLLAARPDDASLEREVMRREEQEVVIAAIRLLPPKQRAVLTLRYYLDMDEATIAKTIGIPTGTVKWRLHAARRKLRSSLALGDATANACSEGGAR